jgi:hypothetical protein
MRNKKTLLSFFLLTLALSSCGIQEDASQTSTGEVLKKDTGSSVTHSGVLGTTSRSI